MHITFAPRNILQIDEARITHRNFSGKATDFNYEGNRNFSWIIEDGTVDREFCVENNIPFEETEEPRFAWVRGEDMANFLISLGWNVKIRPPRVEGEPSFCFLPVKVKFNDRGPECVLITNDVKNHLDEESVCCLDNVDIARVDLDIRPYDWTMKNGKSGRSAYLQIIYVTQVVDRFADRY